MSKSDNVFIPPTTHTVIEVVPAPSLGARTKTFVKHTFTRAVVPALIGAAVATAIARDKSEDDTIVDISDETDTNE